MDVRNHDDHFELLNIALKYSDTLDVWINNAGVSAWKPIEKIDDVFFDELVNVNLKGAFWGCKGLGR